MEGELLFIYFFKKIFLSSVIIIIFLFKFDTSIIIFYFFLFNWNIVNLFDKFNSTTYNITYFF
jgi:hypothetical protein